VSHFVITAKQYQARGKLDLIMFVSGYEVHLALEARTRPTGKGIVVRVFSMPGGNYFEKAPLSAW
jgi:transketolase